MSLLVDSDDAYYRRTIDLLEDAYLAGGNPRKQSGFGGDAVRWERARRLCVEAVDRDGTYLDVGCAGGHLMECVERWATEDGHRIEAHGVDISGPLADLARSRLPQAAERIHHGNVMTWEPPRRYTFVRSNPEFVPEHLRAGQVTRILEHFLEPGGRAIICSYGSSRDPDNRPEPVARLVAEWGFDVAGSAEAVELNGVVVTAVAWIDGLA